MQRWQESYLGLREVPRELSEFELQAFFTFSSTERAVIERRSGPAMKLGLALHLGFVRMSGRPLDAFRVLPVMLLRHLGKELGIPVPDIASLRALYSRGRTGAPCLQSHSIAASWGRADLASSDMMSLETSKRVWQARLDPRRQTASVGVYSPTHRAQ